MASSEYSYADPGPEEDLGEPERAHREPKRVRNLLLPTHPDDVALVRCAVTDDGMEAKTLLFPRILAEAKTLLRSGKKSADALLEAFTGGNKHGRAITRACEDMIEQARQARPQKKPGAASLGRMVSGKFRCASCPKKYGTLEGLRLHARNYHSMDKPWRCLAEGCDDVSFVRIADLRMRPSVSSGPENAG